MLIPTRQGFFLRTAFCPRSVFYYIFARALWRGDGDKNKKRTHAHAHTATGSELAGGVSGRGLTYSLAPSPSSEVGPHHTCCFPVPYSGQKNRRAGAAFDWGRRNGLVRWGAGVPYRPLGIAGGICLWCGGDGGRGRLEEGEQEGAIAYYGGSPRWPHPTRCIPCCSRSGPGEWERSSWQATPVRVTYDIREHTPIVYRYPV